MSKYESGDGITWSKCSACQLKSTQVEIPKQVWDDKKELTQPNIEGDRFEHKTIPGKTSIIIPVYMNSYSLFHYTGNCIGSVREHTDKQKTPYEIIIVDNGSPIKPPTNQSYYADKIILNEENQGVTKAWNKGIRVAFGEYIVLLNNDTQVFEGWLEGLKEAIDGGLDLAMAHPMYSLTEPFARAVESKKVLEGKSKFDSLDRDFSCVMFKKTLYDEVGAFDEQFFNYASDVDYFKRMDEVNLKYKVVDKVAIHHISDATGFAIPETPEIMNKDKAKFEEKYRRKEEEKMDDVNIVTDQSTVEIPMPEGFKFNPDCIICQSHEHQVPDKPKIDTVRINETGDKIYLVENNQIHWIKSAEKYQQLGGEFGKEETISKEEFDNLEKGEPIA